MPVKNAPAEPASASPRPSKRRRSGDGTLSRREGKPPGVADDASAKGVTKSRFTLKKHVLSCIDWPVSGVVALAVSLDGRLLAVARADGSIEMREASAADAPSCSVLQPPLAPPSKSRDGHTPHPSVVSCLAFASSEILLAARMDGFLDVLAVEDEYFLVRRASLNLAGGAVWAVIARNNQVVAACDDKRIRVIRADAAAEVAFPSDPILYDIRPYAVARGRVLCVAWADPVGDTIVAGDARGSLHWLRVSDGHELGSARLRGNAIIWALAVAKGGREVLAADSTGRISVWNSRTRTLADEIRIEGLVGDALSLVHVPPTPGVGESSETVVVGSASGSVGAVMTPTGAFTGQRWTPVRGRRYHAHDIRALAVLHVREKQRAQLVCGSLDSTMSILPVSSLLRDDSPIMRVRHFACPAAQPHVQFIPRQDCVVSRTKDAVEVWRVYEQSPPALLLKLALDSLGPNIRACAVSSALRLVVVATPNAARMYRVDPIKCPGTQFAAKVRAFGDAKSRVPDSETAEKGFQLEGEDTESDAEVFTILAGAEDLVFVGKDQVLVGITGEGRQLVVCTGLGIVGGNRAGSGMDRWKDKHLEVRLFAVEDIGLERDGSQLVRVVAAPTKENRIACWDRRGRILVLDLPLDGAPLGEMRPTKVMECVARGMITAAVFSADGRYFAYNGSKSGITTCDLSERRTVDLRVPRKLASASTSLCFSGDCTALVCSGPNHAGIIAAEEPGTWFEQKGRSTEQDHALVTSTEEREIEKKRRVGSRGGRSTVHFAFGGHENILGACVFRKGQVIIVEKPWHMVTSSLPKAMNRKLFAT